MSPQSNDLSLLAMGVNLEALGAEDPFVGKHLVSGNSHVATHAGEIVAKMFGDEGAFLSVMMDLSHSTDDQLIRNAVRIAYTVMMRDKLARSAIRKKLMVQRVHYGSTIEEIHSFEPLVLLNTATKSTDLNIPLLPDSDHEWKYLGGTASLDAWEKVLADMRALERLSQADIEDIVAEYTVLEFTDGRMNESIALREATGKARMTRDDQVEFLKSQVVDVRRFIKLRNEKWAFMSFCTGTPTVARTFMGAMRNSPMGAVFQAFIQKRLDDRTAVINLLPPENRPAEMPTLESEALQLMYEAIKAGWSYWVDDESEIASIADDQVRLQAQLYQVADDVIVDNIESGYFGRGGLGLKPTNVLSAFHNAQAILDLIGTQMSSSVIRQAGGSQTAIAVNLTPAAAAQEADDAVF